MRKDDVDTVKAILHQTDRLLHELRSCTESSICHIASQSGSIRVIQEFGKILVNDNFKNKKGDTWLHVAVKFGKLEVARYLLKNFRDEILHSKFNKRGENFLDIALSSTEVEPEECVEFINEIESEIVQTLVDSKMTLLKASSPRFETVLHVVAANGFKGLVEKFSFLNLKQQDECSDTALHTAARHENFETLKELLSVFKRTRQFKDALNIPNEDLETVLHIVTKSANKELVVYLVKNGADLTAKDRTGNTPLHDLVDKAAENVSNIDSYLQIWKVIVQNAVDWWCLKFDKKKPYKSSKYYREYQTDSVYYLRSEVPNGHQLSVIQLAATKGLVRFVKEMIWVDGVFVKEIRFDNAKRVEVNITNLMPLYQNTGYFQNLHKRQKLSVKDMHDHEANQNVVSAVQKNQNSKSFLETLLQIKHSNTANEIFEIEPMKKLVRDYWFVYQWWTILLLLFHLLFMSLYSAYSLDMITKAYTETNSPTNLSANQIYLFWPIILVVPELLVKVGKSCRYFLREERPVHRLTIQAKRKTVESLNLDVKDVFNWPSVLLSGLVIMMSFLTPLVFCITTIVALQFVASDRGIYTTLTVISLIFGWLLSLYLASAFESIYRFLAALKTIVLKDIMSFLFFYIFILLAFSNALFAIMKRVPSLAEDYRGLDDVIFELVLLGVGAESSMSYENIAVEFIDAGYDPFFFKILLTSYIIITLVGLLNLIIASMCDTYSSFALTDHQGWRQHSLKKVHRSSVGYLIGSKLLYPLFKKLGLVDRNVGYDKRYYFIKMSFPKQIT